MTDPAARAARAARAAGAILAPDLGSGLPAEVEAAIHESETGWERPGQYEVAVIAGLAISAASLIVTAAQLAWSIVSEHRSNEPVPSHDSITRQIRITLREHDVPVPHGSEHITDVVVTETLRIAANDQL